MGQGCRENFECLQGGDIIPDVCFYFEIHQPFRLNRFSVFHIGEEIDPFETYFNHRLNREIFERAVKKCYLPTTELFLDIADELGRDFKISFSITGTFVEYSARFAPQVLENIKELIRKGCASLIGETYYHSLSSLFDDLSEFDEQVKMHTQTMRDIFGYSPNVFRNTEAIYDNRIAKEIEKMGFKGAITEGTEKILGWRSPNFVYRAKNANLKLLLRNYRLSDDIAFRFSARDWIGFPLTADKFARWTAGSEGELVNIFMDFETFGEHQWPETGIFEFLKHLPEEMIRSGNRFVTVDEAIKTHEPVGEIDAPFTISWADSDRDVSTWLGNDMQMACFNEVREIGKKLKEKSDKKLLRIWRLLQTSDHFYYLSTKGFADGDVHRYFNPYSTPYEAFINYMNILQDLKQRV